jgi:hypothetical protein
MNAVKARVVNGRFVIDEPADLPDGTELYLVPVNEEDEDRLDIEEANKVLEGMKASGKKPVSVDEMAPAMAFDIGGSTSGTIALCAASRMPAYWCW